MTTSRFQTALEIQSACNLSGVARALVEIIDDNLADKSGVATRDDPAVILTLDKLCDMIGRPDGLGYGRAYDACAAEVRETADFDTLVALGLETNEHLEFDGHLFVCNSKHLQTVRAFADSLGEPFRAQLETQLECISNMGRPWIDGDDYTRWEWEWETSLYPDGAPDTCRSFGWTAKHRKDGGKWMTGLVGGLIFLDGDKRWTVHI